jgi:hypothetical protein
LFTVLHLIRAEQRYPDDKGFKDEMQRIWQQWRANKIAAALCYHLVGLNCSFDHLVVLYFRGIWRITIVQQTAAIAREVPDSTGKMRRRAAHEPSRHSGSIELRLRQIPLKYYVK